MRDYDVHPDHIDPETNRPYANYSDPSLDTSFHDGEMDVDDEDEVACTDRRGHRWVVNDGDEELCYCERCGCVEY